MAALLLELARRDRLGHVLRLLAIDRAVVEFDPGQPLLPGLLDRVLALAPRERRALVDDLILDLRLVERLLHAPAGMTPDLDPLVLAAVELDGHGVSFRLGPGSGDKHDARVGSMRVERGS